MAPPISDEQVTYDDGTPETLDQYAKDISAFLMWAAEPHLEERKRTGFMVMVFLVIFTGLLYLTKKSVYANKENSGFASPIRSEKRRVGKEEVRPCRSRGSPYN